MRYSFNLMKILQTIIHFWLIDSVTRLLPNASKILTSHYYSTQTHFTETHGKTTNVGQRWNRNVSLCRPIHLDNLHLNHSSQTSVGGCLAAQTPENTPEGLKRTLLISTLKTPGFPCCTCEKAQVQHQRGQSIFFKPFESVEKRFSVCRYQARPFKDVEWVRCAETCNLSFKR